MEGDLIYINKKLRPLSWLYGLGVGFRNFLFETGILKSQTYATPVISVGNITVGGTGKTPHVEYLIRLLKDKTNLAVLSRGYKRKSSGFVLADNNTTIYDSIVMSPLASISCWWITIVSSSTMSCCRQVVFVRALVARTGPTS